MGSWFYYDRDGVKRGPISPSELKLQTMNGNVTPKTIIENEAGNKGYAYQLKGLFPDQSTTGSQNSTPSAAPSPKPVPGASDPRTEPLVNKAFYCTNCGQPVSEHAVACMSCGFKPTGYKKFCGRCGAALNPEQVMCIKCGTSVGVTLSEPKAKTTSNSNSVRANNTSGNYRPTNASLLPLWIFLFVVFFVSLFVVNLFQKWMFYNDYASVPGVSSSILDTAWEGHNFINPVAVIVSLILTAASFIGLLRIH